MAKGTRDKTSDGAAPKGRAWRTLKGVLVAVATAGVGCGILYGLAVLHDDVRVSPSYVISADTLRLVKGPAWMTPGILAELDVQRLDPEFPNRFSLLDDEVNARIAAAYERSPWVERVERIVKHAPRVESKTPPLEVFLKFRRPIAFVQSGGGYVLVDDKGVRLPGHYTEPRLAATRFIVITGMRSEPPAPAQEWSEPGLLAAVKVAAAVEAKREAFRLATVDVSNFGGRVDPRDTEIALYTTNETRIKWGKAPTLEAERLQEKTPEEKVAYLEHVYKTLQGRVDGVLAYIDIPNEAIRRRTTEVTTTRVRS